MNILIAGGTGLVGQALSSELVARGHSVTALSRTERSAPNAVQWDAKNQGAWSKHVSTTDVIINVAGESLGAGRWTKTQKEIIRGSRVSATRALVEAIRNASPKPKTLLNASAVGYYGNVDEGVVDEVHPAGDDFLAETCVAWETEARSAEQFGVRVVPFRTGVVLAHDANAFKRMILPFKLFAGGPFGSGRQWFSWIHITDVVNGYLYALETPALSGPVNLSSPNPVRVKDLATELGKALKRPSFLPAPAFGLKIILGEMSDLLLKGQQVVPKRLTDEGFTFTFPDLPEALRDILQMR